MCAAGACACACACVSRWRELCEVVGSLTFVSTTSSARASATPRPPSSRRCSPCLNSCPAPPISFLTSSHRCVACSIVICIVQRQLGPPLHKRIRVSPLQSPSDRREHSAMSIAPRTTSGELVSPCISTNAWKAVGKFSLCRWHQLQVPVSFLSPSIAPFSVKHGLHRFQSWRWVYPSVRAQRSEIKGS